LSHQLVGHFAPAGYEPKCRGVKSPLPQKEFSSETGQFKELMQESNFLSRIREENGIVLDCNPEYSHSKLMEPIRANETLDRLITFVSSVGKALRSNKPH
jgi:hypothetical protein